ncbi:ATP-binding protein [Pectobacterium zantedeschiae]
MTIKGDPMKQIEINFIAQVCSDLEKLNGTQFEYFCKDIIELILSEIVQHKGHNLYAKPVKSTADFNSDDFEIVGQCGTDHNYFDGFVKPINDIKSAINNHPQCHEIFLFSNQRATGGTLSKLNNEISNKNYSQKINVYDSEKITKEVILKNILNIRVKPLLMLYVPNAYKIYILFPENNTLPRFTSKKYHGRREELSIIKILKDKEFMQIYGSSGIGKSEISKSIAKKVQEDYETVIWVNGDDSNNINFDFMSTHISRFNTKINLGTLLENHKIIIILDNFNENLSNIEKDFDFYNKKHSLCLITSLQKNLSKDRSFHLKYLERDIAKKILLDTNNTPKNDVVEKIIQYVDGYPLVLSIIRDSVDDCGDSWEDVLNEIKDVVSLEDHDRNIRISARILERSLSQIKEELYWIYILKSKIISSEFLQFSLKNNGIKSLLKRSIINKTEVYNYSVHQIILDSVVSVFDKFSDDLSNYYKIILSYLKVESESKSIGYFNFLITHHNFLMELYKNRKGGDELKNYLIYSLAQGWDENSDGWIIDEIKKISLDDDTKISYLLLIEKIEMELFNLKKKYGTNDEENYLSFCKENIKHLKDKIEKNKNSSIDLYLRHHLGKIYIRIKDYDKAIELFKYVVEKDDSADYARLQIARIGVWHDQSKVSSVEMNEHISKILSKTDDWSSTSLSVLLATYELISENKMRSYREKYIDSCISVFVSNLLYSLSFGFEQPFELLAKLSYHLSYNHKEMFGCFCESLPLPSTIDKNNKIKYAFSTIQVAYYKQLKYSNDSNKDSKMEEAFSLAEMYLKSIDLNDFQRGKLIDLYIESKYPDKALVELCKNANQVDDPFFFQKKCKILRLLGGFDNLEESIKSIDKAILLSESNPKFKNYKSAFLNDKAEALYISSPDDAISILEEAIKLENNNITLTNWKKKLHNWSDN